MILISPYSYSNHLFDDRNINQHSQPSDLTSIKELLPDYLVIFPLLH